jgi:hypothetical protein
MISNFKRKLAAYSVFFSALLCFGVVTQNVQAQPQMDPNQIVEMMSSMIGVTEEQKPAFSKAMKDFFEKIMPLAQQAMSGQGDQAKLQEQMTLMSTDLDKQLKEILTEEQMQKLTEMQQRMGPPPQ